MPQEMQGKLKKPTRWKRKGQWCHDCLAGAASLNLYFNILTLKLNIDSDSSVQINCLALIQVSFSLFFFFNGASNSKVKF